MVLQQQRGSTMANISIDSLKKRTYDAIVIGSGASGGWTAKELCDHGLKTLVLERGRDVKHVTDYPTDSKPPWEFEFRGTVPLDKRVGYGDHRRLSMETQNPTLTYMAITVRAASRAA